MSDSENENENLLVLPSITTSNPKNGYSRMNHFENCIRKYIGVNKIKPNNLKKIKSEILSVYDECSLTRQNIADFGKWKGNENAIFFQITGKTVDDISHLEKHLLANFRLFSAKFDKEKSFGRKKFLNMNYVLFHLLKQLGHNVDEKNFPLLKTEKSKTNQEKIIQKIIQTLNFSESFDHLGNERHIVENFSRLNSPEKIISENYFCRRKLFLPEKIIFAGENYFCRRKLFLPGKIIFAGENYFCRRKLFLKIIFENYFCRRKLFLPEKIIFAGENFFFLNLPGKSTTSANMDEVDVKGVYESQPPPTPI